MPAAANIVLADNTPANHTYEPIEVDPANSLWLERTLSTTSAGAEALRITFSRSSSARPTNRIGLRLDLPYEQTVDGVTTVYDTFRFSATFTMPETMTGAQRDHAGVLCKNLLANAVVQGYIQDLTPVY